MQEQINFNTFMHKQTLLLIALSLVTASGYIFIASLYDSIFLESLWNTISVLYIFKNHIEFDYIAIGIQIGTIVVATTLLAFFSTVLSHVTLYASRNSYKYTQNRVQRSV